MFEPIRPMSTNIKPIDMSLSQEGNKSASGEGAEKFGDMFSKAFSSANKAMYYAGQTARVVATGGNIEMHEVSIAGQKAKIALHLTTQITTKITQACSQIFQMQL